MVDQVVSDFETEGFSVTKQKQPDGNYTVVAVKGGADAAPAATIRAKPADGGMVVIHNVPADKLSQVVEDLTSEGFTVTVQPEPDGEFTVIGTRSSVRSAAAAPAAKRASKKRQKANRSR